ncbi:MFS transporter [Paenibacillus thermoaerophilus]|uniref:MFS transporter n=1 Tax=Paenibacillus thermoaerophilus TaxID=1215385 RepID=A0ABW2V5D2_9BACL|nr:MFS transporter [Paenibacillus thermoaerophilus]
MIRTFTFFYYTSMGLIVTYFPLYFSDKGFTEAQLGLLYASGPFISIASSLFWGILSDKLQTVRKIMIVLFAGQLSLIAALTGIDSFWPLVAAMIGFYFFQTSVNPLNDSLILLTVQRTGGKPSYPSYRVWGSIGFAVSALVCGQAMKLVGIDKTLIFTFCSLSVALALAFSLPERQGMDKKMEFRGALRIVGSRAALSFLFMVLLISLSHRMNDAFLALHMRELGASETWVGLAWMISATSEIPVFFLLARYGDRFKELPLLAISAFVYTIRFMLTGYVSSPAAIIVLQAMHSLSYGIFMLTAMRYLQTIVPDEYRATGQAVYTVVWSGLAGLGAGLIGGQVAQWAGMGAVYYASAAFALLAGLGFLVLHLVPALSRRHASP